MNWYQLEVVRALLYEDVDKELSQFARQTLQGRQTYRAIVFLGAGDQPVAGAGEVQTVVPHGQLHRTRLSIVSPKSNSRERLLQFETAVFNPQHPEVRIGTLLAVLEPRRMLATIDASLEKARGRVSLSLRTRTD